MEAIESIGFRALDGVFLAWGIGTSQPSSQATTDLLSIFHVTPKLKMFLGQSSIRGDLAGLLN